MRAVAVNPQALVGDGGRLQRLSRNEAKTQKDRCPIFFNRMATVFLKML